MSKAKYYSELYEDECLVHHWITVDGKAIWSEWITDTGECPITGKSMVDKLDAALAQYGINR